MGSDEGHFNVSVGSDGQSHKTVSTNNLFEEKGEPIEPVSNRGPSAYQPNALLLGQTRSQKNNPMLKASLEQQRWQTRTTKKQKQKNGSVYVEKHSPLSGLRGRQQHATYDSSFETKCQ